MSRGGAPEVILVLQVAGEGGSEDAGEDVREDLGHDEGGDEEDSEEDVEVKTRKTIKIREESDQRKEGVQVPGKAILQELWIRSTRTSASTRTAGGTSRTGGNTIVSERPILYVSNLPGATGSLPRGAPLPPLGGYVLRVGMISGTVSRRHHTGEWTLGEKRKDEGCEVREEDGDSVGRSDGYREYTIRCRWTCPFPVSTMNPVHSIMAPNSRCRETVTQTIDVRCGTTTNTDLWGVVDPRVLN